MSKKDAYISVFEWDYGTQIIDREALQELNKDRLIELVLVLGDEAGHYKEEFNKYVIKGFYWRVNDEKSM